MEEKQEAEIWHRVMAQPKPVPMGELESLQRESGALEAVYRWAAGRLKGRKQLLARRLLEQELSIGACLRGLGRLSGEPVEHVQVWEPGNRGGKGLLEGCFARERRCQSEYTARSLDGQCGEVYRHLAEQAGKQCVLLSELLGWE